MNELLVLLQQPEVLASAGGVLLVTVVFFFGYKTFKLPPKESSSKESLSKRQKSTDSAIDIAQDKRSAGSSEKSDVALAPDLEGATAPEAKVTELKLVDGDKTAEPAKESVQAAPSAEKATKDLKEALQGTRNTFLGRIKNIFTSSQSLGDDELEELEEILYTSDIGPRTVQRLVEKVSENISSAEKKDFESVRGALKNEMLQIFTDVSDEPILDVFNELKNGSQAGPTVWMVVGVNGAGKTTTIGKLAHHASQLGKKTMVVAGDTFRAAAEDQLKVWSERAGVEFFSPEGVKDPSAVAYDACQKAKAKDFELVIIDTAGRLHTQDNLMDELKKIKRVMSKVLEQAPHETLIVLDSNSGQNALMQAEKFNEAIGLSGAILTKLDGSAKGGVAIGLASQYHIPIKMIGVGESIADLRPFEPKAFVDSII